MDAGGLRFIISCYQSIDTEIMEDRARNMFVCVVVEKT